MDKLMHGQKNNSEDAGQYKKIKLLMVILLLFFVTSCCVVIYLSGKTVSDVFSARIADTITISPGITSDNEPGIKKTLNLLGRITYTNGEPYKNGRVELKSKPRYTSTDSNGYFLFEGVEPGKHTISAVQNGVVLASVSVVVARVSQTEDFKTIKLDNGSYLVQVSLNVIQINIAFDIENDILNLKSTEVVKITENPAAPGAPPGPVVPTVPGVPPGPVVPAVPGVPPGPVVPTVPGVPPGPVVPTVPGGPSGPGAPPQYAPGIVAAQNYEDNYREWSIATTADIFTPRPGNYGVQKISGETVISPGATGNYTFMLKNPDSYAVEYVITLAETDQNNPRLPLRYRLIAGQTGSDYLGGSAWKGADNISSGVLTIPAMETAYFTLEWKWVTAGNSIDTEIGMQVHNPVYLLSVVINAWYK